jgi:hypothetical protein
VKTEVRRRQKCNEFCMKNEKKGKKKEEKNWGKRELTELTINWIEGVI